MIIIKINNQEIKSIDNIPILKASLDAGIYIPHLCSHPDLQPVANSDLQPDDVIYQANNLIKLTRTENQTLTGCQLCLVEIKGTADLQRACATTIIPDMEISTDTERIRQARQENLAKILAEHPHSCLTCAQSEGCSLTQCSSNVPQNERCCPKFNRCELQKVSQYIGIPLSTSRYIPQSIPVPDGTTPLMLAPLGVIEDEPLFKRNYNLCIGCLRCVRACRNLRGVDALGFVINNGKIIVGSKKPILKDSACKFCGACVEVCPTGAILDKIIIGADRAKSLVPCQGTCPVGMDVPDYIRLIKDNHIDKAFEIIQHKVPFPSVLGRVCFHPCEENCRRKELNESISICALKRYANEHKTQQSNFQPLTSNLKHSIAIIGGGPSGLTAAYYLAQKGYPVSIFEANNEVGGMMRYAIPEYRLPLSALSDDLKKITGHPNISIKTNSRLGTDFSIESLKKEGYKAILISIGAQLPKKINLTPTSASMRLSNNRHCEEQDSSPVIARDEVPKQSDEVVASVNEAIPLDCHGLRPRNPPEAGIATLPTKGGVARNDRNEKTVLWGIDFLKDIRNNRIKQDLFKGKSVLVIGGGNVAIDAALSAKRLGAKNIQLVCLESRETMPAHKWEIEQALEEGIALNCSWGPIGIRNAEIQNPKSKIQNQQSAIDFVQCASVFDPGGKFNPSFNSNVCKTFQADIVIVTIGQMPDTERVLGFSLSPRLKSGTQKLTKEQINLNPNRTIKINEDTFLTNSDSVFACGEVVHNPSSIIESIADGRKAAENIDKYLGGDGIIDIPIPNPLPLPIPLPHWGGVRGGRERKGWGNLGRDESFAGYQRIKMPCIALSQRNNNFEIVEKVQQSHPEPPTNTVGDKLREGSQNVRGEILRFAQNDTVVPTDFVGIQRSYFNPVESGYTEEMAQNEARRCLQCDMRLTISPVIFPPETSRKGQVQELEFTEDNIKTAPAKEGVYILMDENKNTTVIKGTMNLQESLVRAIHELPLRAKYFRYEIDPMFTKKESELIQQYLQEHGKLPSGGDELEDLY